MAVVLKLDDDRANISKLSLKIENVPDKGNISTSPTNISDQHRQAATSVECGIAAVQANAKAFPKCRVIFASAQVRRVVAVPNHVPIWRMEPNQVIPARQVAGMEIEQIGR